MQSCRFRGDGVAKRLAAQVWGTLRRLHQHVSSHKTLSAWSVSAVVFATACRTRSRVTQPGSTVATDLTELESRPKHVAIIQLHKTLWKMSSVPLRTVRGAQLITPDHPSHPSATNPTNTVRHTTKHVHCLLPTMHPHHPRRSHSNHRSILPRAPAHQSTHRPTHRPNHRPIDSPTPPPLNAIRARYARYRITTPLFRCSLSL